MRMHCEESGQKRRKMTAEMASEINTLLQSSLEKSKDVEKINVLTNDILEISSQTNLLALNASIEAKHVPARLVRDLL